MADEELLGEMDELGDEEEEDEGQEGGSSLMRYLPLIAGILVVQIVIVYLVVTFFLGPSEETPEDLPEDVAAEVVEEEVAPIEKPKAEVGFIYEKLDAIVVNPAGTDGMRFLSVTVHLGLSSEAVALFIEEGKMVSKINDRLINIFSSKTIGDLEPAKHDSLKIEIVDKLNKILPPKDPEGASAVVEAYFTGFVLQ